MCCAYMKNGDPMSTFVTVALQSKVVDELKDIVMVMQLGALVEAVVAVAAAEVNSVVVEVAVAVAVKVTVAVAAEGVGIGVGEGAGVGVGVRVGVVGSSFRLRPCF